MPFLIISITLVTGIEWFNTAIEEGVKFYLHRIEANKAEGVAAGSVLMHALFSIFIHTKFWAYKNLKGNFKFFWLIINYFLFLNVRLMQ